MKKACRRCKLLVEGAAKCSCGSNQLAEIWKGRIIIFSKESEIAKKLDYDKPGEYAIKVR